MESKNPFDYSVIINQDYHSKLERYIELHVKPRPKWCPQKLWKWLLSEFLILKHFKS